MTSIKNETARTPDVAVSFHNANGAEVRIDQDPTTMKLVYADGEVQLVTMHEIQAVKQACAWHGAKQKLIDAAAISRDPTTGRAASVAFKRQQVTEVLERMRAGQWFKVRGDGSTGNGGLLFRALCELFAGKKTPDEVRAYLNSKSDAEQAAMRKHGPVAAIIERLRPEPKGTDQVDVAGDLAEFGES